MKTSTFALVASSAVVMAQQPEFLNSNFDIVAGEPFELTYQGCDNGCTISLENGPSDDLQEVEVLTSSASGGSFTVTLEDTLPSDDYAFRIVNNESEEFNFSPQFPIEGSGEPATTSDASSSEAASSTEVVSSTETSVISTVTSGITTVTSAPVTSSANSTTPATSATETDASSTTSDEEDATSTSAQPTQSESETPESGAVGVSAQLGFILAAAAAVAFL